MKLSGVAGRHVLITALVHGNGVTLSPQTIEMVADIDGVVGIKQGDLKLGVD